MRFALLLAPLALLALLAAPLAAQERVFVPKSEREAFLKKVSKAMSGTRAFWADFDQEKQLAIFKGKVKSRGRIYFDRPDKLRWEIVEPFRSILIVSGDQVAKFEWVGGKRRTLKLGRSADAILIAMERIRSWFRGEFDKADRDYEVAVSLEPEPLIVLRPRDKRIRKNLKALEFVPTADLKGMRKVTIRERAGDETVMTFAKHVHGIKIEPAIFSLTDPADFEAPKPADGR